MGDRRYKSIFVRFMSMVDKAKYGDDAEFTTDHLLRITPSDVCNWMRWRAFGDVDAPLGTKPERARSSTLEFDKKAISSFMPRRALQWDPVSCRGNPTRAEEVNRVLKNVKKSEVRRAGRDSQARRPIEYEELIQLLSIVRASSDVSKLMVTSVITLQWHLIARIDDMMKLKWCDFSPCLSHPGTVICQMRWSKNIMEERDAPEQIVFGSGDPLLCPLLNLAIYIESTPSVANSEFLYGNPEEGDRVVRRVLNSSFSNGAFSKMKDGNIGTHSMRKGAATYGTRSGLSRDYASRRGRWRVRQAMVDMYIDHTQPFPDASTAAVLAGPRGPCRYLLKADTAFVMHLNLVDSIAPRARQVFGNAIATTLANALLWAALEPTEHYDYMLISAPLRSQIYQAYLVAGGSASISPIERQFFHVTGDGSQVRLVAVGSSADEHHVSGTMPTAREIAGLYSELFELRRSNAELSSEVKRLREDTPQTFQRLSAGVQRLGSRPFGFGVPRDQNNGDDRESANQTRRRIAVLSKRPRDLYELWQEYEVGLGRNMPAKAFTRAERGAVTSKYSRRNAFWEVVARLVNGNITSDAAIGYVYDVYGRNLPVSTILKKMSKDRAKGVRHEKLTVARP